MTHVSENFLNLSIVNKFYALHIIFKCKGSLHQDCILKDRKCNFIFATNGIFNFLSMQAIETGFSICIVFLKIVTGLKKIQIYKLFVQRRSRNKTFGTKSGLKHKRIIHL